MAAPILVIPVAIASRHGLVASPTAWLGFGYVSIISQFLAFFAWYHGMSLAGVARVSQLQLLQPLLTILFSVLLLGERVTPLMLGSACIVIACVVLGRQSLVAHQGAKRAGQG